MYTFSQTLTRKQSKAIYVRTLNDIAARFLMLSYAKGFA